MYFGDSLGAAEALQVEKLDLAKLARAGLYSHLLSEGYAAKLELGARLEVHGAFTHLNLEALKSTGLVTLGLLVIVVDARAGVEIARGEAIRDFRLLDVAPDDGGSWARAGLSKAASRRLSKPWPLTPLRLLALIEVPELRQSGSGVERYIMRRGTLRRRP